MLDELFAKIDAPMRASLASPMRSSLASHMVRSHMVGDSEGKRAFMDFVETKVFGSQNETGDSSSGVRMQGQYTVDGTDHIR